MATPPRVDTSWLKGFLDLFSAVAEETTKSKQNLVKVEQLVSPARARGVLTGQDLYAIETSTDWTYGPWWPRLSSQLEAPVPIGDGSAKADRRLVDELHSALKHIEVVSVLLRFTLPDRFGIYSPPVASLLGLIPSDDPVKTYLSYREVLRKVGMLHQVERIAHVDMALWAAARESTTESHKILRSRMHGDARFQAIVLSNFGEGLSRRGTWTELHRLALARGMMRHDPVSAGARGTRVRGPSEAHREDLGHQDPEPDTRGLLTELADHIDKHPGFRPIRPLCPKLDTLRRLRNRAAHPLVSLEEAREFISGLEALLRSLATLGH